MKNTTFQFTLIAILVALTAFVSCSDNEMTDGQGKDAGNNSENVMTLAQAQKYQALSSLLGVVAEVDSLPANWDQSSYVVEPTLGVVADQGNEHVRYVVTSSVEEADRLYRSMISANVTATASNDTWSMEGIGSLKFTVVGQPDCYATLDVSVQQLPHLEQLRFVPSSALGDNIAPWDDPYYEVGDVICQKKPGEVETYWVCVRPCSKDAGVRKSHWCTLQLNPVGNATNPNYIKFSKEGKADLYLPTNLCKKQGDGERMVQNYFNVLRVMEKPKAYVGATGIGEITKASGELSYGKVINLSSMWEDLGIWDKLSNPKVVSALRAELDKESPFLNAFYHGYSKVYFGDGDYRVYNLQLTSDINSKENAGLFTDVVKQKLWLSFGNKEVNFKGYEDNAGDANIVSLHDEADGQSQIFTENQYIVKYKTGAQLEENKVFTTDNTPGKSFEERGNNYGITDVLTYKKMFEKKVERDEDPSFYAFGDRAFKGENQDLTYYCMIDANNTPASNRTSYFVLKEDNQSVSNSAMISDSTALNITFQLLNAYLYECIGKTHSLSVDLDDFKDCYYNALSLIYRAFQYNSGVRFYEDDDNNYNVLASYYTTQDNLDEWGKYVYPTCVHIKYNYAQDKFFYSINTFTDGKMENQCFLAVDAYKDEYPYNESYSNGLLNIGTEGKSRKYFKQNIRRSLLDKFWKKAVKE